MERRDVQFTASDGIVLRGWIYPAAKSRSACIIMTHSLGGVRQWRLPQFAERFQEAGYSVLLYDNRHWGDSDGLPRQHSNPFAQQADYYDAFNYVSSLPFVDPSRIVYWGSSFSGGNVIYASAIDKRIKAAIIQCSSVSGEVRAKAFKGRITSVLNERKYVPESGQESRTPLIASSREETTGGDSNALFPDIQAYDELMRMEQLNNWTNSVTSET